MCFHKWSKWIETWIESRPFLESLMRPEAEYHIMIGQKRYCLKCGKLQIRRID